MTFPNPFILVAAAIAGPVAKSAADPFVSPFPRATLPTRLFSGFGLYPAPLNRLPYPARSASPARRSVVCFRDPAKRL